LRFRGFESVGRSPSVQVGLCASQAGPLTITRYCFGRCDVSRVLDQETLGFFGGNRSSAVCVWSANSSEAIVSYDEELNDDGRLIDGGVNVTLAGG